MIRNTRRGFNTFGLTPDDDAYETGQRSTTALELRVFGEEANSRLQNWGKERGRDKGIEVADTYVISNTNPENKVPGWGDEGHSGVVILNRKGDPWANYIYDPAGHYPDKEMGEGRVLTGPGVSLDKYVNFQKTGGKDVVVRRYETTPEEEQEIMNRAERIGGNPVPWDWFPVAIGGCTAGVSQAIDGIGPFGPVEKTAFPSRLNDALERAKRYKDKF